MVKKFLLFGVGGVCVLLVLIALIGSSDPTPEKVGSVGETAQKAEPVAAESKQPTYYAIGDIVKVGDMEVTITKAEFTKPAQYGEPDKGSVLTLDLKVENKGSTSQFVDNSDFNIYDPEGEKMETYHSYDAFPISGDINGGRKMSGQLFYDVSKSDKYELVFQPFMTNTEVLFEITPQ